MIRDDKVTVKFIWKDGYEREHTIGKYGCIGIRHKDNGSRPMNVEWVIKPENLDDVPKYVDEIMQSLHGRADRVKIFRKLLGYK
jgi:hypothetical protein